MAFRGQLGRSGLGRFEPGKGADLGERGTVVGVAVITAAENYVRDDSGTVIGVGVVTGAEQFLLYSPLVLVGTRTVRVPTAAAGSLYPGSEVYPGPETFPGTLIYRLVRTRSSGA